MLFLFAFVSLLLFEIEYCFSQSNRLNCRSTVQFTNTFAYVFNSQPRSTNLKTERVQSQPERPNLPTEEMAQENAPPQKKSKARKKRPRYYTAVRRSSRIRNTVTPSQNRSLQPVQITISESESESDREEEPPCLEENVEELAVRGEKTLDEKVDYAVQLLETMSSQVYIIIYLAVEITDFLFTL